MPFNISNFSTQISSSGYLSPSKFNVYVTPPPKLFSSLSAGEKMVFRVDAVSAPSVTLGLADVNRYGVGINQKEPFSAQFNIVNLSFISDGHGELWSFWHKWMQLVFGFSKQTSEAIRALQKLWPEHAKVLNTDFNLDHQAAPIPLPGTSQ